jgi:hypothetical protein
VVETQVEVPPKADARKGIQPVVDLKVNGGVRAEVAAGQPLTFSATIEVPRNTGKIVAVEWNFEGSNAKGGAGAESSPTNPAVPPVLRGPAESGYAPTELAEMKPSVSVKATHTYLQAGTYFPVLRATSQREGDPKAPFARVQNLGRVRVVVK